MWQPARRASDCEQSAAVSAGGRYDRTSLVTIQVFPELVEGETGLRQDFGVSSVENVDPALPPMRGLEGARALVGMFTASFPDFTSKIELVAAEGERVAVRAIHTGTHRGPFLGIPATGNSVTVSATGIFTCQDGKLAQNHVIFDAFGLLQQLG